MMVQGVGKNLPSRKNDKFDSALAENDKLLDNILQKRNVKEIYTTINTSTLTSITLDNHPIFLVLKSEIETFNEEVKKALLEKTVIPEYNWKYSLYLGLRNLLKEIVSTEDKNLKEVFLDRAKQWFYGKMAQKGTPVSVEDKLATTRPETASQTLRPVTSGTITRPITAATRPFTALTRPFTSGTTQRPFTSGTNAIGELNQTSVNMSIIPGENESVQAPSFFENTREEILPSRLRADILKDYEEGARSKHNLVEPPYERILEYERKMPLGILKPPSRVGQRPQTGKTASFFGTVPKEQQKPILEKGMTQASGFGIGDQGDIEGEELSQAEGSQAGEEGPAGEVEAPPPKAGIVVPAKKLYRDDRITGFEQPAKDMNMPMETRSNFANFVPSNSAPELRLEQRWRDAMNKKMNEKREKEEFVTMMTEWSHTKSRLQEEIGRRNESTTFGSRYQMRTFIPRAKSAHVGSALSSKSSLKGEQDKENASKDEEGLDIKDVDEISEKSEEQDEMEQEEDPGRVTIYRETGFRKVGRPEVHDFTHVRPKSVAVGNLTNPFQLDGVEDKVNKLKIDKITRLHSDLIFATRGVAPDVGQDGTYSVARPTSLSVYDQSKSTKYRPFSAVYQTANPEGFRKSQMQDIEEVKSKLAKFKIKVPAKQLKTALLLPELPATGSVPHLPTPGTGLMMNPFFKEKKGKKKKKGGKKK